MAWAGRRGVLAALMGLALLAASGGLLAFSTKTPEGEAAGAWVVEPIPPAPPLTESRDARSGFVHPGVLVRSEQLNFVSRKVRAGEEPWRSAWLAMQRSQYAELSWRPRPVSTVDCGFYSQPDSGCTAEAEDAVAAYTQALMWSFTRDRRYAEKAIDILDAWSGVLKEHTNANAPLQAGWAGATFARAAELIKHTYTGWPPDWLARTERMLRTVYLPTVLAGTNGSRAGNWELIMLDAAVGISVFLDDRASFLKAVEKWRLRLRAYVYLSGDGPLPYAPPGDVFTKTQLIDYWGGQNPLVDGLAQETCRDFLHTGWGLAAAAHVAETAWIQGRDLYAEARERLTRALEFHTGFELGRPAPPWLCGGRLVTGLAPSPEIAFNHYATRMGLDLPNTRRVVEADRPAGPAAYFFAWETLTHAGNPN
ncbi:MULTISPECIES: alginate lyase family protein [unclassified Micromonospora]|uniref:alginate lyase family protein n=1 Tax=Micromonospora sp. NPDC005087 TaxID=3364225 RepID=UPI003683CA62